MRTPVPPGIILLCDRFPSKASPSTHECEMYLLFAKVFNHAFKDLSRIQVNGLPEFKTHIAFVLCNKGIQPNHNSSRSSFQHEIALMSIQDAHEFHELDRPDASKV